MSELKKTDSLAQFRCWGGDLMQKQGGELVKHYRDLAFMGFIEVLANLKTILNNINLCKNDIDTYKPDAIILIDYPGFNLRIAEYAHLKGYKVYYYISPQVWAWHQSRVKKMKKVIDRLFVILPFEKDFFKEHQMDVDFVGHPLLDAIENHSINSLNDINVFNETAHINGKPIIALLPGSRKQEIKTVLPIMLSIIKDYPDYKFIVAGVNTQPKEFYNNIIGEIPVGVVYNQTYNLLQTAKAALVTSGTATLETALFGVPQIVCYKGSAISFAIAKRFVKVKYICLANLILDKLIVTELIQDDLNTKRLKEEFEKIIHDEEYLKHLHEDYNDLKIKLGGKGASTNAAKLIYGYLSK